MNTHSSLIPPNFLLHLRKGKSARMRGGHPWIFSNEIQMTPEAKALPPGTLVTVADAGEEKLGVGYFNPRTLIGVRLFSFEPGTVLDEGFFAARLSAALKLRERLFDQPYYRAVHAEADGLPGLVVDRFGDVLAVQAGTAGMERLKPVLLQALHQVFKPKSILWTGDGPARALEGLEPCHDVALGEFEGHVEVLENGARFLADPIGGQKTGWFFDQRDNRAFAARLAGGGRVLDLYSYAGGFGILSALRGAREAVVVDRSEGALALARKAADINGVLPQCRFEKAEAFAYLEKAAAAGEKFDLVLADPPAFVKSKKDLASGLKGYRKLTRLAQALVKPGGFLMVASCSHHVGAEALFEEIRHGLGRRTARLIHQGGAGPDHPIHPQLPESAYLKAFFLELD
jgi:23S rRNA (cytosine1962-C5)-methyltransferase